MSQSDLLSTAIENAMKGLNLSTPTNSQRGRLRRPVLTDESDSEEPAGLDTPATMPSTPRSSSPTRSGSRMAERRRQRELEAATSHDPLKRLPSEVASRVFLNLRVADVRFVASRRDEDVQPAQLAVCMRVCKKWRKSQTLNYCWYVLMQRHTFRDAPNATPVWTKKDAKEDWSRRYKSVHRRDDLSYATAADADYEKARSDGYRTPREERESRWAGENAEASGANMDKQAAREYYKSLKNAKGAKAGRVVRDRTEAWDD